MPNPRLLALASLLAIAPALAQERTPEPATPPPVPVTILSKAITANVGTTDRALLIADSDQDNWLLHGRTYDNQRFSPLKEITDQNVGGLKLAWAFQVGALRSNEASPIVIDGTMYISSSSGPKGVYALDAKTGALKWQFQPDVAEDVQP